MTIALKANKREEEFLESIERKLETRTLVYKCRGWRKGIGQAESPKKAD